jgi:hypothetical protein
MTRYGFSQDPAVITTSVIPNPGTTGVRRALAGIVAGKAAAGASLARSGLACTHGIGFYLGSCCDWCWCMCCNHPGCAQA